MQQVALGHGTETSNNNYSATTAGGRVSQPTTTKGTTANYASLGVTHPTALTNNTEQGTQPGGVILN